MRYARINTENQLIVLSDSRWHYFPDTGRITRGYILFYKGGPIDHCTHVMGLVSQSSTESGYNTSCNTGMDLENFSMLDNEFLNKDPDLVPEQAPLIILDSK